MTLKEFRYKYRLTQPEIAKSLGVSLNTYGLWERELMNPTPENKEKLDKYIETIIKERSED